ncbi:MAG: outer membrane beta-barrel protein, partial [Bacteroidales bacterium]|nr:outer membrane beta-barrel protein [Bacteroidales bacterium]
MKKLFISLVALAMFFNGKAQDSNIDVEQLKFDEVVDTTIVEEETGCPNWVDCLGAMLEWSYVGANVTYGVSPYRVYMIEVDESLATSIEGIYVEPKYSEFSIAPKWQFDLTNRVSLGLSFYLSRWVSTKSMIYEVNQNANTITSKEVEVRNTNLQFAFAPNMRYYFAKGDKLSFFADVVAGFACGKEKQMINDMYVNTDNTKVDLVKRFSLGVSVTPGLAYKINDDFRLDLTFDLFGLNYTWNRMKDLV